MIQSISKSKKPLLKTILKVTEANTNSTTGSNLRQIMMLAGKHSIHEIVLEDADNFAYFPRPEEESWKLEMLDMMLEEERADLDDDELEWLEFLCVD